ncbi:hypothetical protein CCY99_00540 [Helicobacter sp. 16-1353]|uniref:M16 family metallopeptidase n=1 Tax=Helicobacter sp. 16-1353 TaxID=2004996 RepID=UPI000DCB116C|nr:pitrilysin family protein [Helicobacter sp. 16-1353]RAX55220.1 hypothetical protein CCY99_00540 [Helicobacter sp. 16-1353]
MRRLLLFIFFSISLVKGDEVAQNSLTYLHIKDTRIPVIFEDSNMLPIGFIRVIFNGGGSIFEPKVGLSSFSADLLERGTHKKGEYKFAYELESNAIGLNVNNGMESFGFSLEFIKQKEDKAIKLLGELLSDPNFTNEAFNQTKLNITSYILSKENDFDYIAQNNLNKLIFKGTPLENPPLGDINSIDKITLNDVKDFLQKILVLDNIVILIGGDIELEKTKQKLQSILEFLPKGEKYKSKKYYPTENIGEITAIKPTQQAYIYFASPFYFDNYENSLHKAQVMSFIMGSSGFGSRIMEEIRVKRGLAYSVYFYNVINNVTSHTMGYLQTNLENKDEAINAIKETIATFIKDSVTKEELDSAKAYILGSRVLSDETLSQRLNKKYINFHRGLSLDYDKVLTKKIENLSLDELNDYIKSHKEVNNLSFSIVVDK